MHQKSQLEISYPKFYRITTWIKSPTELWIAKEAKLYNPKKALGLIHISFHQLPGVWLDPSTLYASTRLRTCLRPEITVTISCPKNTKMIVPETVTRDKCSSFPPPKKKGVPVQMRLKFVGIYINWASLGHMRILGWLLSQPESPDTAGLASMATFAGRMENHSWFPPSSW